MSRYYNHDGIEKPSVTTICGILDKPGLLYWAVNCCADYMLEKLPKITNPELPDHYCGTLIHIEDAIRTVEGARKNFREVSKAALDVGSQVHAAIEHYLKTGREPINPPSEVLAGVLAFMEWQAIYKVEPIATEMAVYGDKFAGTMDLHCWFGDEKEYVIDFKTTTADKPNYPEHRMQVAAYRSCVEGVTGCGILYLNKNTGYPTWVDSSETYERDLAKFNLLVDYWYLDHPNVAKRISKQKEAA